MSKITPAPAQPEGFDDAFELTQSISDVADWSENYLSTMYSAEHETGFYLRFVRFLHDPELWMELFLAFLPGDRCLIAKQFGYGDASNPGPSAAGMSFVCEKPWNRWTKRFRGAARLLDGEELRSGPLTDGPYVAVQMELEYESLSPPLADKLGDQYWASGHYEQHCVARGSLAYGDEVVELEGIGLHDHSVGPRNLTGMAKHFWCVGMFPSGLGVMVVDVFEQSGRRMTSGNRSTPGERQLLEFEGGALVDTLAETGGEFAARLELPGGPAELRGRPLQSLPLSLYGTNQWVAGKAPDCHHVLVESMVELELDGETGYGYLEQGVPA